MDERISIVTPDHIELDFELAGLGSRFLALIIDALLMYLRDHDRCRWGSGGSGTRNHYNL
jgi:hypothetical protein